MDTSAGQNQVHRVAVTDQAGQPDRAQIKQRHAESPDTPKTASAAATRRSHQRASSRPPATAWPSTAASTGLLGPNAWARVGRRVLGEPTLLACGDRLEVGAGQNVPPPPVRTATLSASSRVLEEGRRERLRLAAFTALRTSGRLMVTTRRRRRGQDRCS